MKIKKLLCTLLALCMLLSLLPVTAFAAETVAKGNLHDGFTWSLTDDGVLTISGYGTLEDFDRPMGTGGAPWYKHRASITSVTFTNGITYIGSYTLYGLDHVKEVTLPDTLLVLGDAAFNYCRGLESLTLPASLEEIGNAAFSMMSNLKEITIPANVGMIGNEAFGNCNSLQAIRVAPGNLVYTSDDRGVLFTEDMITLLAAPGGLTGKYAIPEGVECIGNRSFAAVSGLNVVTIPSTVDYIGDFAFIMCQGLDEIWFCGNFPQYGNNPFSAIDGENDDPFACVIAYYPANNKTWTEAKRTELIPNAVWEPYTLAAPEVTASNVAKTGKVQLTWDAIPGADSYKIYRATSKDGAYSLMKTTYGTSYVNTNATAGKYYYYKVVAVAADGSKSAPSAIVGRTCDLPRPVVTASNVAKSGKVTLSWEPVEGAVSYKIYRSTSKDGTYSLMKTATGTAYTNTNAVAGTKYYYKVVAVAEKSAANSAGTQVSRTCDLPQVQPTIKLDAKGRPTVTWKAVDGAVSYKVYRSTSENGTYSLMKTATGTAYTNTNIVKGTTYFYKVVAVCANTDGNAAASNIVSITAK